MNEQTKCLSLLLVLLQRVAWVSCFHLQSAHLAPVPAPKTGVSFPHCMSNTRTLAWPTHLQSSDDSWEDDDDTDVLSESEPEANLDDLEKTWRYIKKPLLSIGGKGASASHGNSLRELLESHTAVKVKVNMKPFGEFY